jgi:archaellum component FlaC
MNNIIKGIKLIISGLLSPITSVINGVKELIHISSRVQHIEDNLMYDTTPDEINKNISFIKEQINGLIKTVHTNKYDIKELKNGAQVLIDCVNAGKAIESDISSIKKDINELQLSLESLKPINLGHIEAEALGMQVAQEEKEQSRDEKHDWHREQRLLHEQMNNAE